MNWESSFFDELEKISMSKSDQRKRDAAFTAIGTVAGPIIAATSNMIQRGRFTPPDVKPHRWLAGTMAAGAISSGLVPVIRKYVEHHLKSSNHTKD